jgi:hypothetical protein
MRKTVYAIDRGQQFITDASRFFSMFYARPGRELSVGSDVSVSRQRAFIGQAMMPLDVTYRLLRVDEDTFTVESKSAVARPAFDSFVAAILTDRAFTKNNLQGRASTPVEIVNRLADSLGESTVYTLDARTGWPVSIEHRDTSLGEKLRLRVVHVKVERIGGPKPK